MKDPDGRVVGQPTRHHADAVQTCARLQAEADRKARRGPRPCLCCGRRFFSEGRHNRMCALCRGRADPLAAYGWQGLDTGRKPRRVAGG